MGCKKNWAIFNCHWDCIQKVSIKW